MKHASNHHRNVLSRLCPAALLFSLVSLLLLPSAEAQVDVLTDGTSLQNASGYSVGPPQKLTLGDGSVVYFQHGDADTSWNFVIDNQQPHYETFIQGSAAYSAANSLVQNISQISLQSGQYTMDADLTGSNFTLGSAGPNTYIGLTLNSMYFTFGANSAPMNAASYDLESETVLVYGGNGAEVTAGSTLNLNSLANLEMTTLSGDANAAVTNGGLLSHVKIDSSSTYSGVVDGNIQLTIGSGLANQAITFNGTGGSTYNGGSTINNNTTFLVNGDNNLGTGDVLMGNSSALIFTGTDGQQTTAKTITINDNDELGAATGTTVTFNGQIEDGLASGLLNINDATHGGTVILRSNLNTYGGGTALSNGRLEIGNPSALSDGDLTFYGGTMGNTSDNDHFTINNFSQQGGNLYLYLSPSNLTQPIIACNNTATITGGSLMLDFGGVANAIAGQTYQLIHANGGITGQYTAAPTIVNLVPTLKANVSYSPTTNTTELDANITVSQLPFATAAGVVSPTQTATASYLDQFSTTVTTGPFANLIAGLNSVSPNSSALGGALNQLTPLNFQSFTSSNAFNNATFTTQQFDNYLAGLRSEQGTFITGAGGIDTSGLVYNDPSYAPGLQAVHSRLSQMGTPFIRDTANPQYGSSVAGVAYDPKAGNLTSAPLAGWNAFISGNVILAQNFSDPSAGLSHSDSTSESVQVGADYRFTPHFLAGASFGYGHTGADLDNLGSTVNVNTYSPGIYAAYTDGGWYANALGSYGFSDYRSHRQVAIGGFGGTAASSPSGNQIIGDADGGYDFHRGAWTFGPTTGLQYTHLEVNSYTETGLPGADLSVADNQSDSLRSQLGGHLSYAVQTGSVTLTPHASASWQHEFLDQSRGITSQFSDLGAGSFTVQTANPSRDSALLDLGLTAQVCESINLFGDYSVQAGQENYFGQSVQAGIKVDF